jgi:hypothetical protein
MNKQFVFFATDNDKNWIADILNSFFGELVIVPFRKGAFMPFNKNGSEKGMFLAEKSRINDICYSDKHYDGTPTDIIDCRKSPVLEYLHASKYIEENYFIAGRFYCCSEDKEFSEKTTKLFKKLKKQFWYVKKMKTYISKSMDLESSLFLLGGIRKISTDDLK